MAYTVIVKKAEARAVFVCKKQPALFDGLYPPVENNYVLWAMPIADEVIKKPWNYVIRDGKFEFNLYAEQEAMQVKARKAQMLLQLARATNRHRRVVLKEDVLGQSLIYSLKATESERFLTDPRQRPDSFPWLVEAANFDGVTIEQAAQQISFRHTQMLQTLKYSEDRRRVFTRKILMASAQDIQTIQTELSDYERRG